MYECMSRLRSVCVVYIPKMECAGCRLCLKIIANNDFVMLEEAHKNMLQIVIPVTNWNEMHKQAKMCQKCSKSLQIIGQFKFFCLNNNKKMKLLRELSETPMINKMCCLCYEEPVFGVLVEGASVNLKEMLHRCFPQLSLSLDDLGCCEKCLNSLRDLDLFITGCLETEECIKNYCFSMGIRKEDFNSDEYIKRKNFSLISTDNGIEPVEAAFDAPPEVMETTAHENNSNSENVQESNGMDPLQEKVDVQQDTIDFEKNAIGQVKLADNSSGQDNNLENRESQSSGKFYCDKCDYTAKYKSALVSHIVKHRDPSKTKMHKCEECGHETKRVADLRWHMIIHKAPEEVKMYQCADCPYKTKRKADLKEHVIIHRSHTFKCALCLFETKNEIYLNTIHMLRHEDISKVKIYKCEICSYESRCKKNLKMHSQRMHEERVEKFKCNWCDFETSYKQGIKFHMLIHVCKSEQKKYKCNSCDYEATRKSYLKDHMVRHVERSVTYDCNKCSYKGKLKMYLRRHMEIHKDPSEIKMHKCDICDTYQTRKRSNLKNHMYTHIKKLQTLKNQQEEIQKIMYKISNLNKR